MAGNNKVYRTPQQNETIEAHIATIRKLEEQGIEGKKAARALYDVLNNDKEYQKANEGVTLEQVFEDLADFLGKVKEEKSPEKSDEIIGGEIYALFQMLQDDKLELTDEQNKLIKEVILYGFTNHCWNLSNYGALLDYSIGERNMSINLLCENFKRFSQQDREDIISKIIDEVHEGHKIELYNRPGDSLGYYPNKCRFNVNYSFYTERYHGKAGISPDDIHPLIIETLQNSTNEKFIFEMFLYLKRYDKDEIPQNCISLYSDMEKLKKYITPKILKRYFSSSTNKVFEILNYLGLTITWDVAEQWARNVIKGYWDEYERGKSRYVDVTDEVNKLSEKIIQRDSVKQALNSIIENCKKEGLEKFKQYFSSKYIWGLLDDKYKKPEFVNKHIDDLEPILDGSGLYELMQEFRELTKGEKLQDSDKFHRNVFKEYLDHIVYRDDPTLNEKFKRIWKYIDLTTINEKDFGSAKRGLYKFVEEKGLLGTSYLDGVLKGHGYPKTHSVYYMRRAKGDVPKDFLEGVLNNEGYYNDILSSEEATAFMQDIYATQDENLLKKLFDKIGEFSESCTQEEVNILIRKMIKAISSKEDFKKFYNTMEKYAYSEKFSLFLKIKYLLTGKVDDYQLRKNETKIPSDIYASFISSKIIDITRKELPKVGPSVFVDSDDLMKLSKYYDEMIDDEEKAKERTRQEEAERKERLRKEKEETERIEKEALENRGKGEVVFDCGEDEKPQGRKYILSVERKTHTLKFVTAPIEKFPYHANLYKTYIEEGRCLGGGYIDQDDENKIITLSKGSESYGFLDENEKEVVKEMLEKKFKGYKIIIY